MDKAIKIESTTLGETGADMFPMTLNIGYGATIAIFMGLLVDFYRIGYSRYRYSRFH